MKALKENTGGIVMCLFEILVGILLLINPVSFTSGIIIGLGVILLALGAMGISYHNSRIILHFPDTLVYCYLSTADNIVWRDNFTDRNCQNPMGC